uniref:Uncharacterized protein n=1 Tax=Opuntia streptacantha TaxID=393608 RepID=A0A7C9E4D0_OPUST
MSTFLTQHRFLSPYAHLFLASAVDDISGHCVLSLSHPSKIYLSFYRKIAPSIAPATWPPNIIGFLASLLAVSRVTGVESGQVYRTTNLYVFVLSFKPFCLIMLNCWMGSNLGM